MSVVTPHVDGDSVTTCSVVVRQDDVCDEWGELSKSLKIVDIQDISVALKPSVVTSPEGAMKRNHTPSIDSDASDSASDAKKPKVDGSDKGRLIHTDSFKVLFLGKAQSGLKLSE